MHKTMLVRLGTVDPTFSLYREHPRIFKLLITDSVLDIHSWPLLYIPCVCRCGFPHSYTTYRSPSFHSKCPPSL